VASDRRPVGDGRQYAAQFTVRAAGCRLPGGVRSEGEAGDRGERGRGEQDVIDPAGGAGPGSVSDGCPVRAWSRYQPSTVGRGTPRAAMSARLITGRPLMAGIKRYLLAAPHPLTRPDPTCGPGPGRGRPGHPSRQVAASLGDDVPDHLQSRASPSAFDASGGMLGAAGPGGRAGPLPRRCRSAALRDGPVGRRTRAVPKGRPRAPQVEDDLDRTQSGGLLLHHGPNERVGRLFKRDRTITSRSPVVRRCRHAPHPEQ